MFYQKAPIKQDSSFRILTVLVLFRTQGHALPLSVKNACHSWAAIKEAKGSDDGVDVPLKS